VACQFQLEHGMVEGMLELDQSLAQIFELMEQRKLYILWGRQK
jgi:hypothetical protein